RRDADDLALLGREDQLVDAHRGPRVAHLRDEPEPPIVEHVLVDRDADALDERADPALAGDERLVRGRLPLDLDLQPLARRTQLPLEARRLVPGEPRPHGGAEEDA